MAYTRLYFHCVFSTKERRPLITRELSARLYPYLGGIARQNRMTVVEIGGVEDHIHMLISLPSALSIAKAMQLIKGGSSKWIHEEFPEQWMFAWQKEYGAFSVSASQIDSVIGYIQQQDAHHKKRSFQEEFLNLLARHKVEFDERYIWP